MEADAGAEPVDDRIIGTTNPDEFVSNAVVGFDGQYYRVDVKMLEEPILGVLISDTRGREILSGDFGYASDIDELNLAADDLARSLAAGDELGRTYLRALASIDDVEGVTPVPRPGSLNPFPAERGGFLIQLMLNPIAEGLVAIRRHVGKASINARLWWWHGDDFSPGAPASVKDEQALLTCYARSDHVMALGSLAHARLPFPSSAAEVFMVPAQRSIRSEDLSPAARAFIARLVHDLRDRTADDQFKRVHDHLVAWLDLGEPWVAADVARWVSECMILRRGFPGIPDPRTLPMGTEESSEFAQVLVGRDGPVIFALRSAWYTRKAGGGHLWGLGDHEWRVDQDWDGGSFPYDLNDWRWKQETERLREWLLEEPSRRAGRSTIVTPDEARDFCDATRIQDEYVEAFTALFDLPVEIPAGLAPWLATPPGDVIDPRKLAAALDARYAAARDALDQVDLLTSAATPGERWIQLRHFVARRVPTTARTVTTTLMQAYAWAHEVRSTSHPAATVPGVDLCWNCLGRGSVRAEMVRGGRRLKHICPVCNGDGLALLVDDLEPSGPQDRLERLRKAGICPQCHEPGSIKDILYGMPYPDYDEERFVLGGCDPAMSSKFEVSCGNCTWSGPRERVRYTMSATEIDVEDEDDSPDDWVAGLLTREPTPPLLPELLRSLPAADQAAILAGEDYSRYLPRNAPLKAPPGYQWVSPLPFATIDKDLPEGPVELARYFGVEALGEALAAGLLPDAANPGYSTVRRTRADGEAHIATAPLQSIRDALQMRGGDPHHLIQEAYRKAASSGAGIEVEHGETERPGDAIARTANPDGTLTNALVGFDGHLYTVEVMEDETGRHGPFMSNPRGKGTWLPVNGDTDDLSLLDDLAFTYSKDLAAGTTTGIWMVDLLNGALGNLATESPGS